MENYERTLLVKKEVFLYRLPPLQSYRGHTANSWNLASPDWTGRLRIIAKGEELCLRLEEKDSGELYANCPISSYPGPSMESVTDSSRYFVIRLMNDAGRTMSVGIGFNERSDSFDLNVTVQDHFKGLKMHKEAEEVDKHLASQPPLDLGFKEGQQIRLNLKTSRDGAAPPTTVSRPRGQNTSSASDSFILPPPPVPTVSRNRGARGATNQASSGPAQSGNISLDSSKTSFQTKGATTETMTSQPSSNIDDLLGVFGASSITS